MFNLLATYHWGQCYGIEHQSLVIIGDGGWSLKVAFKNDTIPERLKFYFVSHDTWHGISADDWPYQSPDAFYLDFNEDRIIKVGFTSTQISYYDGQFSVLGCLHNLITTINCSVLCYPTILNQLARLPPCNSSEQNLCIVEQMFYYHYKSFIKCLKPRIALQYRDSTLFEKPQVSKMPNSMEIQYFLASSLLEINEEVFMMETTAFIGSVGGSLGLFLGFSFYSYISQCLEKLSLSLFH